MGNTISNKLGTLANAAVDSAKQLASDALLPQRITIARLGLAELDVKLGKLSWSAADKPQRDQLTAAKANLTGDLQQMLAREKELRMKRMGGIRD